MDVIQMGLSMEFYKQDALEQSEGTEPLSWWFVRPRNRFLAGAGYWNMVDKSFIEAVIHAREIHVRNICLFLLRIQSLWYKLCTRLFTFYYILQNKDIRALKHLGGIKDLNIWMQD